MAKFYLFLITLLMASGVMAQSAEPSSTCLPQGIEFKFQTQIDSFQINYPNCTEIDGDVIISWNNYITNLNGLSVLTSIGGNLIISYTTALTSLNGLENLISIGQSLSIGQNAALTSLTGLENLTSIGGDLHLMMNDTLQSLSGLVGLTSIGGGLAIFMNLSLNSLSGLDNINAGSITDLYIYQNASLSICDVKSVCAYLANPSGIISIFSNATGCSNQEEVHLDCTFGIDEKGSSEYPLNIYPNPASTAITISTPTIPKKNTTLTIYNINGQAIITRQITDDITVFDVSGLSQGVYFVKVSNDRTVMVDDFVKQ
jgi:hypothetical protein